MFDLLNSRNPYAKGTKAPVTAENLESWAIKCEDIAKFIFNLKNKTNNYLRTGHCKTVIWGFVFSINSIVSVTKEIMNWDYRPYSFILTYKFSQDHIELLFNKI